MIRKRFERAFKFLLVSLASAIFVLISWEWYFLFFLMSIVLFVLFADEENDKAWFAKEEAKVMKNRYRENILDGRKAS